MVCAVTKLSGAVNLTLTVVPVSGSLICNSSSLKKAGCYCEFNDCKAATLKVRLTKK